MLILRALTTKTKKSPEMRSLVDRGARDIIAPSTPTLKIQMVAEAVGGAPERAPACAQAKLNRPEQARTEGPFVH